MKSKWLALFLIWLMMLVAYFDRIDIAVAGPAIMKALHLSKAEFGWVAAAFTLGYAVMQAPGGHLADRFGSRQLLVFSIFMWSVFTAVTGLATSLVMMLGIRVIFGVGEGLENGAQFKIIGEFFKPSERSFANAVFLSALALGPAFCTPIAAKIVSDYGWSDLFFAFAVLGLVVGVVLILLLPHDQKSGPTEEAATATESMTFLQAVRNPTCMLCAAGYFLFNMAFWGFLNWVPTYLNQERHIAIKNMGLIGSAPYFAGFVGMLLIGKIGSTVMVDRRPILLMGCYLASGAGLYGALTAPTARSCVVGLSVCAFFLYSIFGPFWGIAVDLSPPKFRGVFTGSVNCCGQIGAFLSTIIIGQLADSMKSFTGAILFMIGALICGALVMVALQRKILPTSHFAN